MASAPSMSVNLGPPPPEGFEFFARVDDDPGSQILTMLKQTDWTEPWLIILMMFHITLMAVNLKFRQNGLIQGTLFVSLLLSVYFSESLNQWAAENWRKFAGRQYFDSSGLFISVVFSIPALFNCMIVVGNWLYQSTLLMVQVKQAQLKQQMRREGSRRKRDDEVDANVDVDVDENRPPRGGRRPRRSSSADADRGEEPSLVRRSARLSRLPSVQ